MKFYRFTLKAAHAGRGHFKPLTAYGFGNSILDAMDIARKLPMVKRDKELPITASYEISEYEYVVGVVQNIWYDKFNDDSAGRINDLNHIIPMIFGVKGYTYETAEGKKLRWYCKRFADSEVQDKEIVEQSYKQWAQDVVDKYNKEKYGLISLD